MTDRYNRIGEDIYDVIDRYMEMAYEEMMEKMEEEVNLKGWWKMLERMIEIGIESAKAAIVDMFRFIMMMILGAFK